METVIQTILMDYSNCLLFDNCGTEKWVRFFKTMPLTAPYSCVLSHRTAILRFYLVVFFHIMPFIVCYSCIQFHCIPVFYGETFNIIVCYARRIVFGNFKFLSGSILSYYIIYCMLFLHTIPLHSSLLW